MAHAAERLDSWKWLAHACQAAAIGVMISPAIADEFPPPTITLVASVDEAQPTALPVVFKIKIANSSRKPFVYWNGGPGAYPDASFFKVQLKDSTGRAYPAQLANGQYEAGSGRGQSIQPGETVDMPAFLEPLPAGDYDLSFKDGHQVHFVVRDDAQLRHSKEADWLAGLRRGEPFYEQMLAAKEDDAVIAALFPDLLADDPTVADRAASALYYVRYPLPPNSDAQMAKAVTKQLAAPREDIHLSSTRRELFGYLSLDLAQFKTDAALRAELELAHSPTLDAYALGSGGQDNQTRAGIVKLLAQFPQPEALQQLRGFLGNADGMVRAWAAVALAQKRDPVAFAFLAKTMESPPLENIGDLFEALRWYSPDLRVAAALRRSTKASDARIRQLARKELKVELEKESAAGN